MRTVFITGSNRGLGLEFVKQYERNGFKVIAACRNPKLADSLNSIKGNIEVTKLDINSDNDFENISECSLLRRHASIKTFPLVM